MPTWKPNLDKYDINFKIRVVKLYCRGKSRKEISELVGKSLPIINAIISHYLVERNANWVVSERFERKVVYLYTKTHVGCTKIAQYLGITESLVCRILKRNNIEIRRPESYRVYKLNEDYFETIDTEDKAYWLGFLMADGCNSRDRAIKFSLNKMDTKSLEDFNKCLGSDAPIKEDRHDMRTLMIHSRKMLNDLIKYGFVMNKTDKVTFPNIPEELHRHFIRGLFDGDGCITVGVRKSLTGQTLGAHFMIAGTCEILESIQNILIENCNVSRTKLISRKGIYVLTYGGAKMLKRIYDFIYSDATIYMERKHVKYKQFLIDKKYL